MGLYAPYGTEPSSHLTRKMGLKPLSSSQIRAARALVRWSAEDLARESALGLNTIKRAELAEDKTSLTVANDLAVRRALQAAGVEFIDEDGGGPGVRLKRRTRPKSGSGFKGGD
jgi:transcriptional regulator with XRE-family HTH domain